MQSCKIEKVDGRLTEDSLHRLRLAYHHVPDGEYRNEIKEWSDKFSVRINNYFHGPVRQTYANWYGCDVTQAKRILKWLAGIILYTELPNGEVKEEPQSLAKYTMHEYVDFLMGIESHFHDVGLTMPDPNEYKRLREEYDSP